MISFGRHIQESGQLDSLAITSRNSSKIWLLLSLLNASRSKILQAMIGSRNQFAHMHKLRNSSKLVNKN